MTARIPRRDALRLALATGAGLAVGRPARAADYSSPAEALDAIEALEGSVDGFFLRLKRVASASRPMLGSFERDRGRHRVHRARIRRRLGLPPGSSVAVSEASNAPLDAVREAQSALVYAHAEALPAMGDALSVSLLLADLVDLARHLTVLDLWIEAEASRG